MLRNVEIRRRPDLDRHSSTSRKAKLAMGGAHCSEKGWTLGCKGAGIAAPHSAAVVDLQPGGQTTLSASQVAAGSKRHRTVEFGTSFKNLCLDIGLL
ncbi:jg27008 [Pararge aegeria aegeria]|uniref:Jg27008 protein n=1 Tax=Pararge aegeria aegeria TaxID=348720 RepID=A0A8S4Q9X1_9NEOP|nr:jg27008 [Pararge aegeria aegeria]